MSTDPLLLDLLAWLSAAPRTHGEVLDRWQSTCPRLTIWEDALAEGLVRLGGEANRNVEVTNRGAARLRGEPLPERAAAAPTAMPPPDRRIGGPIRWRLHLPVPPSQVWAALDDAAARAAYWAESAEERDGAIDFRFAGGATCRARLLERVPPSLWSIEYFGSPVRFELADDGAGGTDLLLVHDGVPSEDWIETHAGWLNVLFPLKAWLLHGVDLRSHDPRRSWVQGFADP